MNQEQVKRYLNRKNIGTLKAKKILGEEKLKELLEADVVPVEWEIFKFNTKNRQKALNEIRAIVNNPILTGQQE